MVTFGYGPENIPSGFEPGFDPRLAHYSCTRPVVSERDLRTAEKEVDVLVAI